MERERLKPKTAPQHSEPMPDLSWKDQTLFHAVGLILAISIYAFFVRFYFLFPSTVEDSFIVFRYASHFATGHGLSWNIGMPHDQGMTGLVWSTILGITERMTGRDPAILAGYLGIFFGAITILFLYATLIRLLPAGKSYFAVVGASALALTPVFQRHSANGLETVLAFLVFAFTSYLATILPTSSLAKAVAITTVATGAAFLIRPDAPAFTLTVLCATIFLDTRKFGWVAVAAIAAVGFVGIETAVMHIYFTTALPLPFYIKVSFNELIHTHGMLMKIIPWVLSFQASFFTTVSIWLGFVLLVVVKGLRLPPRALSILFGAGIFYLYLFTVFPVMNFDMRYQAPLLIPLICVGTVAVSLLVGTPEGSRRGPRLALAGLCGVVILATFGQASRMKSSVVELHDDHLVLEPVAVKIHAFPEVRIASTEAGMLAYYSDAKFLDLVGLNNTFVALHHNRPKYGALLEGYLTSDFGYPDVYVRKSSETASYADLCSYPQILSRYGELGALKGNTKYAIFLLKNSPRYSELRAALAEYVAPAAMQSDPCR